MTLALEGTRVLDLSRLAPGPYCTMILADLGADVIKVEPLGAPFPFTSLGIEEERWYAYNPLDRNKRSIVLNLRTEEARRIFYKLVEGADVVVEGFRPGVVRRLGVDYETLRGINPRIVYCSLSGYGQEGPYKDLPGHDINYISIAGALSLVGERDRCPTPPSNLLADFAGGSLQATIGILAALLAREKTGKGQFLDIAMIDGVVSLLAMEATQYFAIGTVPKRRETMLTGNMPYYNVYEAKDGGYISLGCIEPQFWANLCRALGREDFLPYQEDTGPKREEIFAFLRKTFLSRTRDEWFEFLSQKDVCVAPVYTLDETFSDPQVLHRQVVTEVDHPKYGKVRQVGIVPKLSETPGRIRGLGVLPGEHTEQILLELGYSPEEIQRLRESQAID